MQINRKHRVKTMFTDKSLHENDYSMEKNNLQGGLLTGKIINGCRDYAL